MSASETLGGGSPVPDAVNNVLRHNPQSDHGGSVTKPGPEVGAFHQKLPGYRQTDLRDFPAIAERVGVGRILVKDESTRLELPSFKMLGASWATFTALARNLSIEPHDVTPARERPR